MLSVKTLLVLTIIMITISNPYYIVAASTLNRSSESSESSESHESHQSRLTLHHRTHTLNDIA